jgi:hypothetical protein
MAENARLQSFHKCGAFPGDTHTNTCRRVAQKVMPHIFFSETIYSECMKFMHSITRACMHALVSRWSKTVDVDGDYVEK